MKSCIRCVVCTSLALAHACVLFISPPPGTLGALVLQLTFGMLNTAAIDDSSLSRASTVKYFQDCKGTESQRARSSTVPVHRHVLVEFYPGTMAPWYRAGTCTGTRPGMPRVDLCPGLEIYARAVGPSLTVTLQLSVTDSQNPVWPWRRRLSSTSWHDDRRCTVCRSACAQTCQRKHVCRSACAQRK